MGRKRNHRKRYRVKSRFFVLAALVLCAALGMGVWFMNGGKSQESLITVDTAAVEKEQGFRIMMAARVYISNGDLRYDDSYFAGGYPPDDIGVCTDVVWKGLEGIGVNLKDLIDQDISENFQAYEDIVSIPDPNIDFRLVPQLERFLERNAVVLSTDVDDYFAWQAGDIVTFESSHVAIVSSLRNIWGRPYIIQHGKDPAAEEDRIFASDGMEISGHFRWPAQ